MVSSVSQKSVPLWRYSCPDCGFGDGEIGHLAPDHAIYCEICLEDSRYVKLRRWEHEQTETS